MKLPVGTVRSSIGAILFLVVLIMATNANALEKPEYQVLYKDGRFEYRMYKPFIVAETLVQGESSFRRNSSEGFRRLFRYISGNNTAHTDIDSAAPAQMESSGQKIAMTVPVQQSDTGDGMRMAFMLPAEYTMESAPVPNDRRVQLRLVPSKLMAVLRYSGRWSEKNYRRYEAELLERVAADDVDILGPAETAAYNPPFMPPFMRRNEVMVEVSAWPSEPADNPLAAAHQP